MGVVDYIYYRILRVYERHQKEAWISARGAVALLILLLIFNIELLYSIVIHKGIKVIDLANTERLAIVLVIVIIVYIRYVYFTRLEKLKDRYWQEEYDLPKKRKRGIIIVLVYIILLFTPFVVGILKGSAN